AMEVPAKEGIVYLQGIKFGKKNWKRIWAMLFQASSSGIGRMELCSVRDGGAGLSAAALRQGLRRTDRTVIRLADCLSVSAAPEESCPPDCTAFYLNTTQRTYMLAAEPSHDWVSKLCQLAFQSWPAGRRSEDVPMPMAENELYSSLAAGTSEYTVTVHRTEAAIRCNLTGCYLLSLGQGAMSLLDPLTGQTIYCWPYHFLRRFGQDKDGVTIEAGRRCESGEGHFTFLSKNGMQIYRAIEDAIAKQRNSTFEPRDTSKYSTGNRRRDLLDGLSSCPDTTIPVVLPRSIFPSDVSGKLPLQQVNHPHAEPEDMLYSTLQVPFVEKQQPGSQRMQWSPPVTHRRKSRPQWEEEEYGCELEDEETLHSLESICLDDLKDDVCEEKSPLYYNCKEWIGEKEVVQQDCDAVKDMCSIVIPKAEQEQLRDSRGLLSHTPPDTRSTEMPADFKQKLSNILFKDLAKVQPQLAIRNSEAAKTAYDQDN
uniref:Docking protein 3 n=1 Tax=Scleropages formosus TaxID=113540 RepID=A0A8C9UWP6_SCLFO